MKRLSILAVLLLSTPNLVADSTDDWRVWRGPNRNGIAASDQKPVSEWSADRNVIWKVDVPGRGHSSPIVVSDLVVLTTADEQARTQSVVAFDRERGRKLWERVLHKGKFCKKIHKKNTHASPTPSSDGTTIYATFPNDEKVWLSALDLRGRVRWSKEVGAYAPRLFEFGYAPSPLLWKDAVIVASDFEQGFLAAFEKGSGTEIWRTPRHSQHVSYSSPIIAHVAGKDQLLISGRAMVASYDPGTGKLLWSTPATTNATCGTMVWEGDLVFASGGYPKKETVAIRADGSKEIVWKNNQKCYEQSMLVHDGYVYGFTDSGRAICWRAEDGEQMWIESLAGPVSASPILANGNIYASNERGKTFVFKADPAKYDEVARNELGDESFATPTICGGRIYLRHASRESGVRQETLYCIGAK